MVRERLHPKPARCLFQLTQRPGLDDKAIEDKITQLVKANQ